MLFAVHKFQNNTELFLLQILMYLRIGEPRKAVLAYAHIYTAIIGVGISDE